MIQQIARFWPVFLGKHAPEAKRVLLLWAMGPYDFQMIRMLRQALSPEVELAVWPTNEAQFRAAVPDGPWDAPPESFAAAVRHEQENRGQVQATILRQLCERGERPDIAIILGFVPNKAAIAQLRAVHHDSGVRDILMLDVEPYPVDTAVVASWTQEDWLPACAVHRLTVDASVAVFLPVSKRATDAEVEALFLRVYTVCQSGSDGAE